jgi:hypothetical protein
MILLPSLIGINEAKGGAIVIAFLSSRTRGIK